MDQESQAKTLAWLKAKADNAITESRNGNTLPAGYMGSYASTCYYLNNVHRGVVSPLLFAASYPYLLDEADGLRVAEEQQAALTENAGAMGQRIMDLEKELADMRAAIAALTSPAVEPAEPTEAEGDEPPAVTSGEGEPETVDEPPADKGKKGK